MCAWLQSGYASKISFGLDVAASEFKVDGASGYSYDLDFKGGAKKDLSKVISGAALGDMCVFVGGRAYVRACVHGWLAGCRV